MFPGKYGLVLRLPSTWPKYESIPDEPPGLRPEREPESKKRKRRLSPFQQGESDSDMQILETSVEASLMTSRRELGCTRSAVRAR